MKPYLVLKSFLDFIFALGMSIVLSPVLLIIAFLIKITSPGPVLFKQRRVGKNKRIFEIYKFRTMRNDTPKDMPTHLFTNATAFITPIGKILRKTSLDELPQLFNILRGEMSFIGPRPALWNQYDLIAERDKYKANDIKPGITGWAQINGRDELEISVKAQLDGEYVHRVSFPFDLRCLVGTFRTVLSQDGIIEGATSSQSENEEN